MLHVYNWEPIQLLDTVQMGWKNLLDMIIHKDQLVCFLNVELLHRYIFVSISSLEHLFYKMKFVLLQFIFR